MNDPYRFENLTPDQLEAARQQMLQMKSPTGEPMSPDWVDRVLFSKDSADSFNNRPQNVREAFFLKVGSVPAATSSVPDLGDIIRQRLETAPEEKPMDLGSVIRERIQTIGQEEQKAAAREQQILAASVPQIDAAGKAVGTASAPPAKPRTRSFGDFLKGIVTGDKEVLQALRPDVVPALEAGAALTTQAAVAPVAAAEQLIKKGVQPGAQDVFTQRMKESTYEPRSPEARGALEQLGKAFEASKLPPVMPATPPAVLPRPTPIAPGQKPRLTYKEFQAQQSIIKRPDPADLPGLASVGAAGRKDPAAVQAAVDMLPPEVRAEAMSVPIKDVNLPALESHAQALNLPEPIRLTRGQATGDLVALSQELNRRGELPNIAQRLGEQNKALVNNLTLIREKAAPDVFGTKPSDFGQQVIDGYLNIDKQRNDVISKLYGDLRDAAGGQFPIDAQKFVSNADQNLRKQLKSEFLPPEIERQLQRYRDGSGMTFEEFEALRTNLAAEIRKADRAGDGNRKAALGFVRDSLENLPLTGEAAKLKPLADAARKAAKERFDALRKDPAYSAAVEGKVAPENFIDTFVIGKGKGTEANVRQMMTALGKGTPEQQAVAAGLMEIISRKAIDGQGNFSQAAYNKLLRELDPKLLDIFDADSAKQLKNLGEVSRKVMAQPKGGFANNSNTLVGMLAEKAGKAAEIGLNISTANVIPLGTIAKQARQKKAAEKFQRETLEPLAGVRRERTLGEIFRGQ